MSKHHQRVVVPDTVELWSYQTREFYDHLMRSGTSWTVSPDFDADDIPIEHNTRVFAYQWLAKRMQEKGVLSPVSPLPAYPVWAWFWWYGENKKRPDLRYQSSRTARGTDGCVLIKLHVPREFVCLTDFNAWHNVLNHWYFPANEDDDEVFDAEVRASGHTDALQLLHLPPGTLRDKMETSWEKVFDINAEPDNWWFQPYETRVIQATMFALAKEHVREAWWLPPVGHGRVRVLRKT